MVGTFPRRQARTASRDASVFASGQDDARTQLAHALSVVPSARGASDILLSSVLVGDVAVVCGKDLQLDVVEPRAQRIEAIAAASSRQRATQGIRRIVSLEVAADS